MELLKKDFKCGHTYSVIYLFNPKSTFSFSNSLYSLQSALLYSKHTQSCLKTAIFFPSRSVDAIQSIISHLIEEKTLSWNDNVSFGNIIGTIYINDLLIWLDPFNLKETCHVFHINHSVSLKNLEPWELIPLIWFLPYLELATTKSFDFDWIVLFFKQTYFSKSKLA